MKEMYSGRRQARVLVVDDIRENLLLVAGLLKKLDVDVVTAGSGPAALTVARQEPLPDLVLLDIMMPGMDGHAVLKSLQAEPRTRRIPVIFLTALDQPGDEAGGLQEGAVDYITKPINGEVLRARVGLQLELKFARDRLAEGKHWLEAEVARRIAENARLEARLQLALAAAGVGIWEFDHGSGASFWNDTLRALLGRSAGPSSAAELLAQVHPEDRGGVLQLLVDRMPIPEDFSPQEIRMQHADGRWLWVEIRGKTVECDPDGGPLRSIGTVADIGERKAAAEYIEYLSTHDTLTGLPNRRLLMESLQRAVADGAQGGSHVGVVVLELERLRAINEIYGTAAGDAVLVEVGRRLQQATRPGDILGRLSGSRFGIVLARLADAAAAAGLVETLLAAIGNPMPEVGRSLGIAPCVGVSLSPPGGKSAEELQASAEMALEAARAAGPGSLTFWSEEMDAAAQRRIAIANALPEALARQEMSLVYQPQVSLDSGAILGMEALLRWRHPTLGEVSPKEFVSDAEESGLMLRIGEWVLRTACADTRRWLDLGLNHLRLAVNLSAAEFLQPDFDRLLRRVLADTGLPAAALELEVTDQPLAADPEAARLVCSRLKTLGVKLVLDDFGGSRSSMVYLAHFPFDKIKIEQTIVRGVVEDPASAAIARASIAMAHSLNLGVVAEGVETEAQAGCLRNGHCDAMQGFVFEKPLPAADFESVVVSYKRLPALEPKPANEQTLLLVDDEPNILSALNRLLRREGYRILTATTAGDALEKLARQPVQVIISDQRMPEMSGIEFFARVRQLYPNTLRILLTGYTDLEAITSAINVGAVHKFLTKPWDDDRLRDQIRDTFRNAKALSAADNTATAE